MSRIFASTAVLAAAIALLGLVGCAQSESAGMSGVWGYVASADDARIELAERQVDGDTLVVDRVLAPGDAWIVVHADDNGAPGMRVGISRVDKGESTDVRIALDGVTTPKVIVAVHADRGTKGEFDFDMMDKEMSPDRPYFVGGRELAKVVTVLQSDIPAE